MAFSLFLYFHIKRPIRPDPFCLRPNRESIHDAADLLPERASLSADNHLGAHFANRDILLLTPQTQYGPHSVDYILVDMQEGEFKEKDWWPTMRSIIASGKYSPVFFSDAIVLLKASDGPSPLTAKVLEHMDKPTTRGAGRK